MATGDQLVKILLPHIGEKYHLGAIAPKDDPRYKGPWDCAEFASWGVFQISGKLYGCANNDGDPGTADAYSGFWARDAERLGKKISIEKAQRIRGAVLIRMAAPGQVGHVAISKGDGRTVEAHSTKTGVLSLGISGRRWDFAVLVPWLEYTEAEMPNLPPLKTPKIIYRVKNPTMEGPAVQAIQKALGITADGIYGKQTAAAVRLFQANAGLVADGEVGPQTASRLGVTL